jgi:hypothetical protein
VVEIDESVITRTFAADSLDRQNSVFQPYDVLVPVAPTVNLAIDKKRKLDVDPVAGDLVAVDDCLEVLDIN